jgi:hypothetical protein
MACCHGDGLPPWRRLDAESSLKALRRLEQYEDFLDLSKSKNMVFNVKTVKRWRGPDTSVMGWKEAIPAE